MAGPLISVDELAADLAATVVLDCRWYLDAPAAGKEAYAAGHIPGARFASLDDDLSAPTGPGRHPLPTPEAFGEAMGRLGVTPGVRVVTYDDRGGAIAARAWWMLTAQGHASAFVLDGGLPAWVASGRPLSTTVPPDAAGSFPTRPWRGVVDVEDVLGRGPSRRLVDVRATERYRGDEEPVDPKAGHIPGAVSLPTTGNLDASGSFLPPEVLHGRYTAAGVGDDRVIVHCGSGVTACHTILAMELAGMARPDLYVGSWSDWASRDLPVRTGDTP